MFPAAPFRRAALPHTSVAPWRVDCSLRRSQISSLPENNRREGQIKKSENASCRLIWSAETRRGTLWIVCEVPRNALQGQILLSLVVPYQRTVFSRARSILLVSS